MLISTLNPWYFNALILDRNLDNTLHIEVNVIIATTCRGKFGKYLMSQLDEHKIRDFGGNDSDLSGRLYPIHEVCRITGLEPSRIQFIELEFAEHFASRKNGMQSCSFDQNGMDLLVKIHDLIFKKGESPFAVRKALAGGRRHLRIIAVTSGKGGVGKTTLSLNLAIALAGQGLRTLLVDADMGLGNIHVFAGIAPRGSMMDLVEGRSALKDLLSPGPGNIQVLCGNSGSTRMADIPIDAIGRVGHALAKLDNDFDVIVIDTGAGISAHVTQFLMMADEIVVVTTPNIAATLDGYGIIKVAREASMRGRIHVVVNQADSDQQAFSVYEKIRQCSQKFLEFTPASLGAMMRDTAMEDSNQTRRPLVLSRSDHGNARVIREIAASLGTPGAPAACDERDDLNSMGVTGSITPAAA